MRDIERSLRLKIARRDENFMETQTRQWALKRSFYLQNMTHTHELFYISHPMRKKREKYENRRTKKRKCNFQKSFLEIWVGGKFMTNSCIEEMGENHTNILWVGTLKWK